jgi:hypothetical protein
MIPLPQAQKQRKKLYQQLHSNHVKSLQTQLSPLFEEDESEGVEDGSEAAANVTDLERNDPAQDSDDEGGFLAIVWPFLACFCCFQLSAHS